MPTFVNGRTLGVAQNGIFTASNTDPIPGGILWNGSGGERGDHGAAQSWNDMRAFILAEHGVDIGPAGPDSTARPFSRQVHWRNVWCAAGDCGKAAVPGTSNHGWAIAVDIATQVMAALVLRYGHRFGWSWDEGRRAGEWWHFRYIGGYKRRILVDPLTRKERRLLDAYPKASFERRERILDFVADNIREIRQRADHERGGWGRERRRERYRMLEEWFNGQVAPRFLSPRERRWKMAYYGANTRAKQRALAQIGEHVDDLTTLGRRRGWDRERLGDRRAHMARFVAHRR